MKKRNINLDLVKCIAVFSVISVHFFLNNGFYLVPVIGEKMYISVFFRTLFMICVPLFMVATGYLMKDKKLSKKYYWGISRVLIIYTLTAILYFIYNKYMGYIVFDIKEIIKRFLKFDVGYSWYVEMYIGLFLLIPFINLIYNNLKDKKEKKILIITMLFLTAFQGLFNIREIIIPTWWTKLYPITYYFIGCYLKEYKISINKIVNILLLLVVLFISSFVNIKLSNNGNFFWGVHNDWGSIFNVLTTFLVFIFIINLKLDKIPLILQKLIIKMSELSFGTYLLSAIVDNYLYKNIFAQTELLSLKSYFIIVPLVFVTATFLSFLVDIIYKIIDRFIIKGVFQKNKISNIVYNNIKRLKER